jgi:sugar phosphate isomerase/epimerase
MKIQFFRSIWGMDLPSLEANLKKIKQGGFDGVELAVPDDLPTCRHAQQILDELGLAVIVQQWRTDGSTVADHIASFERQFERSVTFKPLYLNSHTGRDHFSLSDNLKIFDQVATLEESSGITVLHETHRSRALFSVPSTVALLAERPNLKLTADFSHWCCVHESLLEDQQPSVDRAIERSYHIHARIGHAQGPQITDPRDPAWEPNLSAHLAWWKKIVARRRAEGCELLTICPEFGPAPYMVHLPHTHKPIADLWDINCYMMAWLRERLPAV